LCLVILKTKLWYLWESENSSNPDNDYLNVFPTSGEKRNTYSSLPLDSNKKLQEILFRIDVKRTFGSFNGKDETPPLPKEVSMRIWLLLEAHLTHSKNNEIKLS
jgi:hypothetical protein